MSTESPSEAPSTMTASVLSPSVVNLKRAGPESTGASQESSGDPSNQGKGQTHGTPSDSSNKRLRISVKSKPVFSPSNSLNLLQPSPPPVSPVVLGFQLAPTGPAQDAAQLALRMKEQQQLLIQQRKLEGATSSPGPEEDELAEEDDTAMSLDPLPSSKTESTSSHQPESSSTGPFRAPPLIPILKQEPPTPEAGSTSSFPNEAHAVEEGKPASQGAASASARINNIGLGPSPRAPDRRESQGGERRGSLPSHPPYPSHAPKAPHLPHPAYPAPHPPHAQNQPQPSYPPPSAAPMHRSNSSQATHPQPRVTSRAGIPPYPNGNGVTTSPYPPAGYPPSGRPPYPPPHQYAYPLPTRPHSPERTTFLGPFERFYDALVDSRTLQSTLADLSTRAADMHRRSEDQIHRVEEHHRRSVAVLNTLQASSSSLQEMVRKEVAVVREELRREVGSLWSRNKQLEEALVRGGLEVPPPIASTLIRAASSASVPRASSSALEEDELSATGGEGETEMNGVKTRRSSRGAASGKGGTPSQGGRSGSKAGA